VNLVHRKRNKKQTETHFPTVHGPRRIPPDLSSYQGPKLEASSQQRVCYKNPSQQKKNAKDIHIETSGHGYKHYFLVGFKEKRGRLSPNPGLCCRRNSPSSPASFSV